MDTTERILHNEFMYAINDSFEKEKQHLNFVRIMGIFGTLLTSIVGFLIHIRRDNQHNDQHLELRKLGTLLSEFSSSSSSLIYIYVFFSFIKKKIVIYLFGIHLCVFLFF